MKYFNKALIIAGLFLTACTGSDSEIKATHKIKSLEVSVPVVQNDPETIIAGTCDLVLGQKTFNKCEVCHSVNLADGHKIGPNLFEITGRKAGRAASYTYSEAMKNSKLIWNSKTLSAFLEKPKHVFPKTKMAFSGLRNRDQREALICFLKNPPPR